MSDIPVPDDFARRSLATAVERAVAPLVDSVRDACANGAPPFIATHEAFMAVLEATDGVDPAVRLACVIELASRLAQADECGLRAEGSNAEIEDQLSALEEQPDE